MSDEQLPDWMPGAIRYTFAATPDYQPGDVYTVRCVAVWVEAERAYTIFSPFLPSHHEIINSRIIYLDSGDPRGELTIRVNEPPQTTITITETTE